MTKTPELHGVRIMQVESRTGVTLNVLDIEPGAFGAFPAARSDERQVEFYDTRYPQTIFGQFTGGRYYASDLLSPSRAERTGLALNGNSQDWTISADAYSAVVNWLKENGS